MENILIKLAECIECGKINEKSPYPPSMKGQKGASELTEDALKAGISPNVLLNEVLICAMGKVGEKYAQGKIFVPQMLLSAKAMNEAMSHLKKFFQSGDIKPKGTFIIGTVSGDLHDIGKNLVAMMVEGAGWKVIDLGTDVHAEQYVATLNDYPDAVCGMSALLTTTMTNMKPMINEIHKTHPKTKVIVGGAPLNAQFAEEIGADAYGSNPQEDIDWLNSLLN